MRKVIAMFALIMFTAVAAHANYYTLDYNFFTKVAKINEVQDGGPTYPGAAYYQYTYTQPSSDPLGPDLQYTSGWIIVTPGAPLEAIPSNATYTDIRVQRFHIFTGAPVGPLYDLW